MSALATLPARRYRWVDRTTKLLGVGLIAMGLEAGGGSWLGLGLAAAGVCIGLVTIGITSEQ